MKFVCAIDFTLSNGNPKDSNSLHSMMSEHVSTFSVVFGNRNPTIL